MTPQVKDDAYLGPVNAVMANLRWSRKCHGKVCVSISPVVIRNKPRSSVSLLRYANNVIPMETVADRKQRKYAEHIGERPVALDSREKFQDDALQICGWGKLSPRRIFRRQAADTIQEVCWVASQKYDNQGIFCTGTLPSGAGVASFTVMSYSGWIVNRVKQLLRDSFCGAYTTVHVWENTKAGRPHFHMAVMSNDHEALLHMLVHWHDWWFGILRDLTRDTGVNLFERTVTTDGHVSLMSWYPLGEATVSDAQMVRQDIGRYLSKYVSKGVRSESSNSFYHPSRWWGVDNKTRKEAAQERIRLQIGGLPYDAIKICLNESRATLGAWCEKQFNFTNPIYSTYGGTVVFIESGNDLTCLAQFAKYLIESDIDFSLETGK